MITKNPPKVTISHAHSKLILLGEHAVVYGKPAIAIPFPLEVAATVERREGALALACTYYTGPIDSAPIKLQGIAVCIKETLKHLKRPLKGLLIQLHSEIPLGRGLGSSAAIAISIVRGLFAFFKETLSQKTLTSLVQISEIYAHGNPSGIDIAAASSEVPIWFQKQKEVAPLKVGIPLHLVVADSGLVSDTLTAVQHVKMNYTLEHEKTRKTIYQIERIARAGKLAISEGNVHLLGRLLNMNHEMLKMLGVSDDLLNQLVEAARNAGAFGAKLTGGGRGGCIIALAKSKDHAEELEKALVNAGARKTWYFMLEKNNMY